MRGTVTKKRDKWYIVYYIGKDESGKWKQKWEGSFPSKKEAEKVLRSRIDEIENSFANKADSSTVAVYLKHWLENYCIPRLAVNTVNGYRVNIEKHMIPLIGEIQLNKLQPKDIQTMYDKLAASGLSGTSIRYVHNTLHKALVNAVKSQILSRNAADCVYAPTISKFEVVPLTPEESRKLITACKDKEIYMPVLLALVLGFRRGEVLGLQWNDVDFDYRTVSIKHSANIVNGEFVLSDPKTKNSHRTLMLSDSMIEYLQNQKAIQDKWRIAFGDGFNPHNLVICRRDGMPMTANALQHMFKDVLTENQLPNVRFHDLRHTNATLMLRSEVPAKIVSSMLGHANIGITLDTYSHVMTDMQKSAVGVVDNLLKNAY